MRSSWQRYEKWDVKSAEVTLSEMSSVFGERESLRGEEESRYAGTKRIGGERKVFYDKSCDRKVVEIVRCVCFLGAQNYVKESCCGVRGIGGTMRYELSLW